MKRSISIFALLVCVTAFPSAYATISSTGMHASSGLTSIQTAKGTANAATVDPFVRSERFAWDPIDLRDAHYLGYVARTSWESYFVYRWGDCVVTRLDSIECPIEFVGIPDTVSYITKSDLEQILRTDTFFVENGSIVSYAREFLPYDDTMPYKELGMNDSLAYVVELVMPDTVIVFERIVLHGDTVANRIHPFYIGLSIDSLVVRGTPPGPGYLRLRIDRWVQDTSLMIADDSVAFNVENIFSSGAARLDTCRHARIISGISPPREIIADGIFISTFPNPFAPTTRVSVRLPEAGTRGPSEITISNELSQIVRRISLPMNSPSSYSFSFDGSDLTAGIYFVTVSMSGCTKSIPMSLVR